MKTKIINYIRAGYPGLYLVSPEEQRVELELKSVAAEMKFKLFVWSVTAGMLDTAKGSVRECNDPLEALLAIRELPDESICVLRDLQMFLGNDANPILVRQFREVLQVAKTKSKTLVVLGCRLALPPELERELTVLEFALPGKEQLHLNVEEIRIDVEWLIKAPILPPRLQERISAFNHVLLHRTAPSRGEEINASDAPGDQILSWSKI